VLVTLVIPLSWYRVLLFPRHLAALLWPNRGEQQAPESLRQSFVNLRQMLDAKDDLLLFEQTPRPAPPPSVHTGSLVQGMCSTCGHGKCLCDNAAFDRTVRWA
jgi:hypothetical protein